MISPGPSRPFGHEPISELRVVPFIPIIRGVMTAAFHPFPKLPGELRNAIWELSIHPREVVIKGRPHWTESYDDLQSWPFELYSSTEPLGALQACRESRSLISSPRCNYTRAFSIPNSPRYTWVNFDIDTIRTNHLHVKYALRTWRAFPSRPCPIRFLTVDCPRAMEWPDEVGLVLCEPKKPAIHGAVDRGILTIQYADAHSVRYEFERSRYKFGCYIDGNSTQVLG